MSSRTSRSTSIPIPAGSAAARNIENVISMPFATTPTARPRLMSSARLPGPSSPERAVGGRSIVSTSPVRTFSGSYSSAIGRAPAGHSAGPPPPFEPRIIRATSSSQAVDPACFPSSTLNRARRSSVARTPSLSTASLSPTASRTTILPPALVATAQAPPFQRPAYLEQSSLRDLLYTDAPPPKSSNPLTSELAHQGQSWAGTPLPAPYPYLRRETTPTVESDDESNASVPPPSSRATPAPTTGPSPLLTHPVLRLPTRWSDQDRHPSLTVSPDGRELTFYGSSCLGDRESAAARSNYPIAPACGIYYYEVEILQKGSKGHISIGFASSEVRLSRLPGWEKHSWGYHADDGWSFPGHKDGNPYGPTFDTGDIIGCGIDFTQHRAFYTKNGAFLGMVFENVGKGIDIYPSVGLRHTSESIRVNFGHAPFKYAIDDHVHAQRDVVWQGIQSTRIDWDLLNSQNNHDGDVPELVTRSTAIPKGGALEEERMKAPIRKLVLSYLAHHGYARTAQAFQSQCEGASAKLSEHSMDTDDGPMSASSSSMDLDDELGLRTRIDVVNSVLKGDIDSAITLTQTHHPSVLEREQGIILFKLRCRKFVELILEASDALKKVQAEEQERAKEKDVEVDGLDGVGAMDVDDPSPEAHAASETSLDDTHAIPVSVPPTTRDVRRPSSSTLRSSSSRSPAPMTSSSQAAKTALHTAIEYGQTLEADYKNDARPEVRTHLKRTFGIVAYADPLAAGGEVADMAGQEARSRLANELNQAILESQGKPAHPALETLYRQTAACIVQLGLLGVGSAAFADMSKEFLDA